jgi:hypothetical protein
MAEEGSRKFGEGHFMAWIREGFKELAQALEAFPGQGIHHVEEAGLVGNPTPQIVTQEMGASYQDLLREASQRAAPEQDLGMER